MEEKTKNMFVAVAYNLYSIDNGKEEFIEEATIENPYTFLSGFGMVLPAFESAILESRQARNLRFCLTRNRHTESMTRML